VTAWRENLFTLTTTKSYRLHLVSSIMSNIFGCSARMVANRSRVWKVMTSLMMNFDLQVRHPTWPLRNIPCLIAHKCKWHPFEPWTKNRERIPMRHLWQNCKLGGKRGYMWDMWTSGTIRQSLFLQYLQVWVIFLVVVRGWWQTGGEHGRLWRLSLMVNFDLQVRLLTCMGVLGSSKLSSCIGEWSSLSFG
jgi:hypothetical protein